VGNDLGNVLSIGHSNQGLDSFLHLLAANRIEVVVDVRSSPQSRFASQFNAPTLRDALRAQGMRYLEMGRELGGRPEDPTYYDSEGHVRYDRLAASEPFLRGIDRLVQGLCEYRVAVMCSEEDPANCHRWRLIGRVLGTRGIEMAHIRGDGTVETDEQVSASDLRQHRDLYQMPLFDAATDRWRSTKPVGAFDRGERSR
jgi:uncharacterized protein (DUF488 family)